MARIRVADNFNQANTDPLGGTGNWVDETSGAAPGAVVNNQLTGTSTGPNPTIADNFIKHTDAPPANHAAGITIVSSTNAGSDTDDGGPMVRMTGESGYVGNVQPNVPANKTTWDIFVVTAGSGVSKANGNIAGNSIGGYVEVSAVGNNITLNINNSVIGSLIDTSFATGGYGMHIFSNLGRWDDFLGKDFVSAAITGTATAGITANDIVTGGKTIIATLSGDTYVPDNQLATIALRGTPKANNAANGGNVVLTFDGGANAPQTGDWVIVFGGHGNAVTTLLPPGQNAVNDGTYTNVTNHTGSAQIFGVWKKKMGATPDTKVTCSGGSNASDGTAYAAWVLQNVDPVTSEDATVTVNNSSSTNPNPNSITTVTNGAVVLAMAASRVNDASPGTISGYSNQITSVGNDTNPTTVSGMLKTVATAGAEDPGAFSSWSTGIWQTATMALRPRLDTPFNNIRQNIINGTVGTDVGAHGWNIEVQAKIAVTDVVRTSNTVATITLDAEAGYSISVNENVQVTIPAVAVNSNLAIVGTPQFVIQTSGAGPSIKYTQLEHAILRGAFRGALLGRK